MPRSSLKCIFALSPFWIGMVSCALAGGPDLQNLKLVSVAMIQPRNPADAATGSTNPWDDRAALVVNFSAERGLYAYAKQYEYNIGNTASFCRRNDIDKARLLQNDPYVFSALGKVDAYRTHDPSASAGQPTYHVYVAITPVQLAGQSTVNYDLRRDLEDICIQLRGGNMVGGKFTSNVIVIPKATIGDALTHRSGL